MKFDPARSEAELRRTSRIQPCVILRLVSVHCCDIRFAQFLLLVDNEHTVLVLEWNKSGCVLLLLSLLCM